MKHISLTTAIVACSPMLLATTLIAGPFQTIDFGSTFRDPANGIIILDDQFDAVFAQHGVRFSSPTNNPIFWMGADYGFQAGASSLNMGDPRVGGVSTYPLRVDFLTPVNFASIQGIDGGGDFDTLTIRAFTSNNILLDQQSVTNTFGARQTVSVLALGIDYILIEQSGDTSGVFLDNLSYIQVPAPSTLAIFTLCLATRRKR